MTLLPDLNDDLAVNFRFKVDISLPGRAPDPGDSSASFQEVSGIAAEMQSENYHEGGQNQLGDAHKALMAAGVAVPPTLNEMK